MTGKVLIVIAGDSSSLQRSLKEASAAVGTAEASLAGFSASMSSIGANMKSFGKKMTTHMTLPIAALGYASFKLASDLTESLQKSNVVFGQNAKSIESWAETGANSFGLSKQKALEAASTYGNLFDSFGVGDKETYKMSKGLTQLAADMASFNNTSIDDAIFALRSGMTGITKPLKRYGVAVNDARVRQQAFDDGLIKSTKDAMSPAIKSQAIYALVMHDTKNAQGDFKRTSNQAANSLRTLTAHVQNAGASIGVILLPYVINASEWISKVAEKFQHLSLKVKNIIVVALVVTAALGPLIYIFGTLFTVIGAIATPIGLVVAGIAVLAAGFVYLFKKNQKFHDSVMKLWPKIVSTFKLVASAIRDYWDNWIYPALHAFGTLFNAIWNEIIKPVANWIIGIVKKIVKWWDNLSASAKKTFMLIAAAVYIIFTPISILFPIIIALISYFVRLYKTNETFKKVVDAVWKGIQDVCKKTWEILKVVFEAIWWYITTVLVPVWTKIWEVVSRVWKNIAKEVSWYWDTVLYPIFQIIWTYITEVMLPVWSKIWDVVKWVWDKVSAYAKWMWENYLSPILGAIWTYITEVLVPVWKKIWDGIQTGWDAVSGVFETAYNAIKGFWEKLMGVANKLPQWMKDLFGVKETNINLNTNGSAYGTNVVTERKRSGANAVGGWMFPGKTYLTGEKGPELVTPTRTSYVNSNSKSQAMMSAGTENNIYIKTTLGEKELIDLLRRYEVITAA